jgi:acyl CoA:acetate/3-ketoacid CoA transferase alpha subunit
MAGQTSACWRLRARSGNWSSPFVSLDAIPLEPWFRRSREAGSLEVLELDEGMFQWGLKAAAFGLPFLPTRVGLGTDLAATGRVEDRHLALCRR